MGILKIGKLIKMELEESIKLNKECLLFSHFLRKV